MLHDGLLQFIEQFDREPGEIVDEVERVLDLVRDAPRSLGRETAGRRSTKKACELSLQGIVSKRADALRCRQPRSVGRGQMPQPGTALLRVKAEPHRRP